MPAPAPVASSDEDDDLPRPGKVWDNSGPSLSEMLKQQQAASEPVAPNAEAPNIEPMAATDLPTIWKSFLTQLTAGNQNLGVSGLLANGRLVAIDDGQAIVRIGNDVHVRMLDKKKDIVRETLAKVLSRPIGVRFELDLGAPAPVAAATSATGAPGRPAPPPKRPEPASAPQAPSAPVFRPTPDLMEQIQNDPLVRAVVNELGATIAKVTEE